MGPDIHAPDGMRVAIPMYWPSPGSGHITTVTMTDEDKKAAAAKPKQPIGFVPIEEDANE